MPHGGSEVLVRTRVNIFQKIAKAAFVEIPPKLESALEQGSDELLDLADSFRQMSLYVEGKLIMASYYEGMGTAGAGGRVSLVKPNGDDRSNHSRLLTRPPLPFIIRGPTHPFPSTLITSIW